MKKDATEKIGKNEKTIKMKIAPDAGFELALFEEEVVFETTALPLD